MTPNSKPGLRTLLTKFIRRNLVPFKFLNESEKFFKRGGNNLLVPKNLNAGTTCIDFGGYLGDWVKSCLNNGNKSSIIVFEPVPQFADAISKVANGNPLIRVLPYALNTSEKDVQIHLDGAASSFHINNACAEKEKSVKIRTKPYTFFRDMIGDIEIDWIKMNIEGAEYKLLEYLDESGLMLQVQTLVIQFHQIEGQDLDSFHALLSRTHVMAWGYEFVWERWDLKQDNLNYLKSVHI